jgi:hypothetical protein
MQRFFLSGLNSSDAPRPYVGFHTNKIVSLSMKATFLTVGKHALQIPAPVCLYFFDFLCV